jgi:hypothetical protein
MMAANSKTLARIKVVLSMMMMTTRTNQEKDVKIL